MRLPYFSILCHPPGMFLHPTAPPLIGGGPAAGNYCSPMVWPGSPLPLRQPPTIDAGRIPVRSPDVDTELSRWGLCSGEGRGPPWLIHHQRRIQIIISRTVWWTYLSHWLWLMSSLVIILFMLSHIYFLVPVARACTFSIYPNAWFMRIFWDGNYQPNNSLREYIIWNRRFDESEIWESVHNIFGPHFDPAFFIFSEKGQSLITPK